MPEGFEITDEYYVQVSASLGATWSIPNNEPGFGDQVPNMITMASAVYSYEIDYDMQMERVLLIGTTTTVAGSTSVVAERSTTDGEVHELGIYTYKRAGEMVLALIGNLTVWEVAANGAQTTVPIPGAIQGHAYETVYHYDYERSALRIFERNNIHFNPETAEIVGQVSTNTDDGEERFAEQNNPVYYGHAEYFSPRYDEQAYEDLPGADPITHNVRIDISMYDDGFTVSPLFSKFLDDPDSEGNYNNYPFEFWSGATFHYTFNGSQPAGSITTRLAAKYSGSSSPIAGDGMPSGNVISEDVASLAYDGYDSPPDNPYYALFPTFYITPPTGPGYEANLADAIDEMWIEGSYVETPEAPWRQTKPHVEATFYPTSDTASTTPDPSDFGAPVAGLGPDYVMRTWLPGETRHYAAFMGMWRQTHMPSVDAAAEYYLNDFAIITRWDDTLGNDLSLDLDLSRARFTGIRG